MTRRVAGLLIIGFALFVAFGFPASVLRASNGLTNEISQIEGFEVVETDQRVLSLFWNDDADVATMTLRATEPTDDVEVRFRTTMQSEGFSYIANVAPFHETYFHQRYRDDSFDADMYRILSVDDASGTIEIGTAFFDFDSITFAPIALVVGSLLVVPGVGILFSTRPETEDALVDELA